jgi:hypothetical protein
VNEWASAVRFGNGWSDAQIFAAIARRNNSINLATNRRADMFELPRK